MTFGSDVGQNALSFNPTDKDSLNGQISNCMLQCRTMGHKSAFTNKNIFVVPTVFALVAAAKQGGRKEKNIREMSNGMATFPDHLTPVITVFHSFMFYDYFAPSAYQSI